MERLSEDLKFIEEDREFMRTHKLGEDNNNSLEKLEAQV